MFVVFFLGVSKRASPAHFGPAGFWPVLNGSGRAGPTRQNGLFFGPGPWGGGLAHHPFPDMFILWPKIRF